jgi:two-component system response regulator NreC
MTEEATKKTTILLADDHGVVRRGLRALLDSEPDNEVVGETGDGLEALRLVERLKPSLLVLDLLMPGLNGLEILRQVGKLSPKTRVLILSMHSNEAYVLQAMRSGASAYVLKGSTAEEVIQAVREVKAGRRFLSPPLSDRAIETYLESGGPSPASTDHYESLTTRERQVLQLLAEGLSNAAIAKRLFISARTVESHRSNLTRKLDLHGPTQLIRFAMERGILARPTGLSDGI